MMYLLIYLKNEAFCDNSFDSSIGIDVIDWLCTYMSVHFSESAHCCPTRVCSQKVRTAAQLEFVLRKCVLPPN